MVKITRKISVCLQFQVISFRRKFIPKRCERVSAKLYKSYIWSVGCEMRVLKWLLLLMKFILHLIEICKKHSYEYQVLGRPFLSSSLWQKVLCYNNGSDTRKTPLHANDHHHRCLYSTHTHTHPCRCHFHPYSSIYSTCFTILIPCNSNVIHENNEILLFSHINPFCEMHTNKCSLTNNNFKQLQTSSIHTEYSHISYGKRFTQVPSTQFYQFVESSTQYE